MNSLAPKWIKLGKYPGAYKDPKKYNEQSNYATENLKLIPFLSITRKFWKLLKLLEL